MTVEDRLYKLDHQLRMISGVADVSTATPAPHEIRLVVVLRDFDWDVRQMVVELVDDFAREHVREVTVLLEVVDAADVQLPLSV